MTPRWIALLAIFVALLSPAQAANICTGLAAMIRQGAAESSNVNGESSAIARLAAHSGGTLRVEEPKFGRLPKRFPHDGWEGDATSITPLGKSGVVAVVRTAGTAHCQTWAFFRDTGRRATPLPNPAVLNRGLNGEICWDHYGEVTALQGTPVFITEDDGKNHVRLTATPWLGKRWGAMCSIAADFTPGFRLDAPYCKQEQARCAALEREAMALVRRYRNDPGQLSVAAISPLAEAKDLDLPTFGISEANPYTRFGERWVTTITVNGESLLAVVGEGNFGWREYPGTLAAFWRVKDGKLQPVAGYQVRTYRGAVRGVTAKP